MEKNKSIENDVVKNSSMSSTQEIKDSTPWYICDYKVYRNRADYIKKFFMNPIINGAIYDKYEEMNQVSCFVVKILCHFSLFKTVLFLKTDLYVIAVNEDSILDDG